MTAIRFRPGRRAPHPEETHPRLRLRRFLRVPELPADPADAVLAAAMRSWLDAKGL